MSGRKLFRIFKYFLFSLLMFNLFYYLVEDLNAYRYLPTNASLGQILETFAVTIDYVAWMILVVLFELETAAPSEERLKQSQRLKLFSNGTIFVCYAVLVYAFWGYIAGLRDFIQFQPIASETVCEFVGQNYAYVTPEARFVPVDAESCALLSGGEVFKHRTDNVISAAGPLAASVKLGWIDVLNASAWLLVVLLFEIEVIFQSRGALTKPRLFAIKASKGVLYLSLLCAAIYWTVYGAFIDSWDAYLWLLAFIMIDLNIFQFDDGKARASAQDPSVGSKKSSALESAA